MNYHHKPEYNIFSFSKYLYFSGSDKDSAEPPTLVVDMKHRSEYLFICLFHVLNLNLIGYIT